MEGKGVTTRASSWEINSQGWRKVYMAGTRGLVTLPAFLRSHRGTQYSVPDVELKFR